MEPVQKSTPDRGISLSTALWLMGCGFILAASASFWAYVKLDLPWWIVAVAMGLGIGLTVMALEQFITRPIERLTRGLQAAGAPRDGELQFPPVPNNFPAPVELRRLWRALRVFQEQQSQARLERQAGDAQLSAVQRQARALTVAGRSLRPDVSLADTAPGLLRDVAAVLGVPAVYLVPLRRHCPVPVLGPVGVPDWAEALKATGLAPWSDLFAQDMPVALSLTSFAPDWAALWTRRTLWVVPLVYHGRALGLLLAVPSGAQRGFTREETSFLEALAPLLAASLHPPRWSEERKRRLEERREELDSGAAASEADDELERSSEDGRRRGKRRRQRQGA